MTFPQNQTQPIQCVPKNTLTISLHCLLMLLSCCLLLISPEAGSRGGRSADNQEKCPLIQIFPFHIYHHHHQVKKPVIKEWCYKPSDLQSPSSRLALSQIFANQNILQTKTRPRTIFAEQSILMVEYLQSRISKKLKPYFNFVSQILVISSLLF